MELRGIIQSDLIIRGAILAGLDDLRTNSWVLDHVFSDLAQDELTRAQYGDKEVTRLKEWFLGLYEGAGTGITVFDAPTIEPATWPAITIQVLSSSESENKLADEDADLSEDDLSATPVLAGPLSPAGYSPLTGLLALPAGVSLPVVPGSTVVVDRIGNVFPVLTLTYSGTTPILGLPPGSQPDLVGMTLRATSGYRIAMETAAFEEEYQIGCYVATERAHLYYLHSLVMMILLRGRQSLLEARGLERTSLRSGGVQRAEATEAATPIWSRTITMRGVVRPVWPKARDGRVWGVDVQPDYAAVDATAPEFVGPSRGAVPREQEPYLVDSLTPAR